MDQKKQQYYDVLVVGGSLEGCMAAYFAAQDGKTVLLAEETGALGGAATNGLEVCMPWIEETDPEARCLEELFWRQAGEAEGSPYPLYQDQKGKVVLQHMLREARVTVLTHLFPVRLERGEYGWNCSFAEKTGYTDIAAERVIDATADCRLAQLAGWTCGQIGNCVSTAVKCSGVEGTGATIGRLNIKLRESVGEIYFQVEQPICYRDAARKEAIITGLQARVDVTDPFALSEAQARLRGFAYELCGKLRDTEAFRHASIVHVASMLMTYGTRRYERQEKDRLYVINADTAHYSNSEAVRKGLQAVKAWAKSGE